MTAIARALADGLRGLRTMSGAQLVEALPKAMTAGLDTKEFGDILVRHRDALYPESVTIDLASSKRVAQSLVVGGLLKPDADLGALYDPPMAGGCLCAFATSPFRWATSRSSSARASTCGRASSSAWSGRRGRASPASCAP